MAGNTRVSSKSYPERRVKYARATDKNRGRGAPGNIEGKAMNRNTRTIKRLTALLMAALMLLSAWPTALAAEDFSAVVTVKRMTVYRDERLTQPMGELQQYSVVRVATYADGIAYITYNGIGGYAMTADMDTVEDFAQKAMLVATSKVYASPNRQSDHVLGRKGLHLYVLATKNGWAMVEMDGNVGYVETDRLAEADDGWKVVADAELDEDIEYQAAAVSKSASGTTYSASANVVMYASPTTKGRKVTTIQKYAKVKVMASNRTWAYVKAGAKHGYCQKKKLKKGTYSNDPKAIGQVRIAKLPVFKSASVKSKKLGTLKKGTRVYMIRWNRKWAYIKLNGRYGYTATSGLKRVANISPSPEPTTAPTPQPDPANAIPAVVKAKSVTVYKSASAKSKKLGTLKKGAKVSLLQASGSWAQIKKNGRIGWCKLSALEKKEPTGLPSGFSRVSYTATVITAGAKAYASPNTAADSTALGLGAALNIVAASSDWAAYPSGSGYAYTPLSQISHKTYATVSDGSGAVDTLLKALLNHGYFDGNPSTSLSADATQAIKRFQAACGLSQSGVADQTLQRILYGGYAPTSSMLSKPLTRGNKNSRVTRLQSRLFALGYLCKVASVDGDYGSTTANAVSLFQRANSLVTTGSADVATLKAMYSTRAKALPTGTQPADGTGGNPPSGSTYMTYMPGNTASTVTSYKPSMSNAKKLEYAIYVASTKLKCPYVYGAVGPSRFDCSGLTMFCMNKIGVSLQRTAYQQGYDKKYTKLEAVSALRRGDLVFFNTVSDSDMCDHVGIYLGGGYFIHASSGGHMVVCSQLVTGYYNRVFSWGRRILK